MRPVIEIKSTKIDTDNVYMQLSNARGYFGGVSLPMKEYRAYVDTMLTGSLAIGRGGCEISLTEEGF